MEVYRCFFLNLATTWEGDPPKLTIWRPARDIDTLWVPLDSPL